MAGRMMINKLTFGSDDAELDEKQGFLEKVFLKTSIFERAKGSQRELVIGRKGSGKSAMCLMLKKAFEGASVTTLLLTPQQLSDQKLEQLKTKTTRSADAYRFAWKYAFLVALAKEIFAKQSTLQKHQRRKIRKAMRELRKVLVHNNEIEPPLLHKIIHLGRSVSKISLNVWKLGGELEVREREVMRVREVIVPKLQMNVDAVLDTLNLKWVVLVDRVDEVWNETEESELTMIGLCRAVHELNMDQAHSRFMLFLRTDIYDGLKFNDADKLHSLEERITWREMDLKHLIANRGRVSAGLQETDIQQLWETFFDRTVAGEPSFDYIVRRTLMRPRELIQFCNLSLAEAQDHDHERITEADILEAEKQYSSWKVKDLAGEFSVQYPYLDELLGMFQGFTTSFSYEAFEKRFMATQKKLGRPDLQTVPTNQILQFLYVAGVLGAREQRRTVFFYNEPHLPLAQQETIVVHPAFHLALGLSSAEQTVTLGLWRGRDINISGVVTGGNLLIQPRHTPTVSSSRELEQLQLELAELHMEKRAVEEQLNLRSQGDIPVRLRVRYDDLRDRIATLSERIANVEKYRSRRSASEYQLLATTRTPALVVYMIDTSGSMSERFDGTTKIAAVTDALNSVLMRMVQLSTKGMSISPRFNLAMFAYSDDVYDILGGIRSIADVARLGIPQLTSKEGTETAKAFREVELLLRHTLPDSENGPAPLVCHITDGIFTGEDPTPIAHRIMRMRIPDGHVLVENIFISEDVMTEPVIDPVNWPGIRTRSELQLGYGQTLFDISSVIPESYRRTVNESGYNLAPDAKMLFPTSHRGFLQIGVSMSGATPIV